MCDSVFCEMEFPEESAPDGLNRAELLKLFQDVLWENAETQEEYDEMAMHIPRIPDDIFGGDSDSGGGGRRRKKHTRTKKGKKGKRRGRTHHQRGGMTAKQKREKLASIMSLISYAGTIALLPRGAAALTQRWGSIEQLLVSVEFLPRLCSHSERMLELIIPWGGECALNDELYTTIVNRCAAAISLTAGAWVASYGGVKETIKAPFNWMKTRFADMIKKLGVKDLEDIAQDVRDANGNWTDENIVDFTLFYKEELEEAGEYGGVPVYMGKLESVWREDDEPDSQDHWGPDYEGLGSRGRRHYRGKRHYRGRGHPRGHKRTKKRCR